MREITYENHSIQYLVTAFVIMKTETEHSCIWFVKND